jgi:hypothetical protein
MKNCLQLFVIVRDCSPVFGLFALFATVLSLYNEQYEQLNSSPLTIPLSNRTQSAGGVLDWRLSAAAIQAEGVPQWAQP